MKTFKKIGLLVLALATAFASSCTAADNTPEGGGDDLKGEHVLRIYCQKAGFGVDWVQSLIEEFKKQDWVKEKYPDLQTSFTYNEMESFASSKLRGGKGVCNFDLLMGTYLKGEEYAADLTDLVYKKTIPGEDATFKDKFTESMLASFTVYSDADVVSYKAVPWSGAMLGYVYNAELLADLGYEMPVTTDEFIATAKEITALRTDKYSKGYAFLSSSEGRAYWPYAWIPLVTQYMGADGLMNFYEGIDQYGRRSNKIFEEKGRLRALQFFEELYKNSNKLISPVSDDLAFMSAQLGFMKGEGLFMPCGSWYNNEMKALREKAEAAGQKIYDIRMMKTPVISAIIEVLPDKTITDDATLRKVIRAIDGGATEYAGVSKADFDRVAYARAVEDSQPQHDAIIPSYADNKEIAADFLLFMASDKGSNACYRANGCPTAYVYDIKAKDPELYASLNNFDKGRVDMLYGNAVYGESITPPAKNTRMTRYGGIDLLRIAPSEIYTYFSQVTVQKDAQKLYDETKNYWTADEFSRALQKAGY